MEYHALVMHFWQTGTFWVAVAVFIFFASVGGKAWDIASKVLDKRAEGIRTALDEAAVLKAEAEAMLANAKARQEQAIKDAENIIAQAEAEAARTREQFAAEARTLAKRRERLALDRIAAAEKAALEEVRSVAIDVATATAANLLRSGFAGEHSSVMIDHSIAGVPTGLRRPV
jgi:F-type H+-transporting ATPase subunit b